jgi:retron-type reverse transcriptase
MNERGKSDGRVVPAKPANKAAGAAAESVEERRPAERNTASKTRPGHSAGAGAPSALDRVREVARRDKDARFTALLHHVDVDRLREAYRAIRPQAAPGVDGVTWTAWGQELEANLADLHDRVHAGRYRARPSRRAYIPKADGRSRPLGIAALEDKLLQRAVVEVLNAVYEADFLGFSYGFRPGRSPHDALDALSVGIGQKKVNWVLDADIRDFFTRLDHHWLEKFLEHRIADKRVLRLIRKWLAAGVIEDGNWSETGEGAPQGASASPLLANVYLHYVLDLWADWWRRRYAHGDVMSLLAFVACPTPLKRLLKVAVPAYLYSGPVPVASLASVLLGLEVNARHGDQLRTQLYHKTQTLLDHLDKLGIATSNTSGFPIVELALADPGHLDAAGRHLFDRGIFVTMAPYPVVPCQEVGFRIQVTAATTHDQLDTLITVLSELDGRFGFRRPHP